MWAELERGQTPFVFAFIRSWPVGAKMREPELNLLFFAVINIDGQDRRSRSARSTVSSKPFERASVVRSLWPGGASKRADWAACPGKAGPVAQLARAHP